MRDGFLTLVVPLLRSREVGPIIDMAHKYIVLMGFCLFAMKDIEILAFWRQNPGNHRLYELRFRVKERYPPPKLKDDFLRQNQNEISGAL